MTQHATDPLSLILQKLGEIQSDLSSLSHRVSTLEGSRDKQTQPTKPVRTLKSVPKPSVPPFYGALRGLDESALPATDKLAFATGYHTAKLGVPPDKLCLDLGMTDYSTGYDLGLKVVNCEIETPKWDLSQRDC